MDAETLANLEDPTCQLLGAAIVIRCAIADGKNPDNLQAALGIAPGLIEKEFKKNAP